MKASIACDSLYGNTEKIASAIAEAITPFSEVKVLRPGEASPSALTSIDLLIVGSPTHGGRPTPAVQELLNKVTKPSLKGVNVAAFGTRSQGKLARVFGNAAGRMAGQLTKKGCLLIASPEDFSLQALKAR